MHPFGAAVQARDAQAAVAVLDDDVIFSSPIAFKPYVGKAAAAAVLTAVLRVFEDFAYEAELASGDGRHHALMFRARVGGKDIQGCDFLHQGDDGRVDRLTVMVRPLTAALALRDQMAAQLAADGTGAALHGGGHVGA